MEVLYDLNYEQLRRLAKNGDLETALRQALDRVLAAPGA